MHRGSVDAIPSTFLTGRPTGNGTGVGARCERSDAVTLICAIGFKSDRGAGHHGTSAAGTGAFARARGGQGALSGRAERTTPARMAPAVAGPVP